MPGPTQWPRPSLSPTSLLNHPLNAYGPFIDTIIVSTASALVVILSGYYGNEMYQPRATHSFESAKILSGKHTGWSLATKQAPSEKGTLQRFRDGKSVLSFAGTPTKASALTLSKAFPLRDAIRFSYFRTEGQMQVRLSAPTGKALAQVSLGTDKPKAGKHKSDKKKPALRPVQCGHKGRWTSCVLLPNASLIKALKAQKQATFRVSFVPQGTRSAWAIDRLQSVSKVKGIALTAVAFDAYLSGFGAFFVSFAGFLFAFSTLLTWSYYGEIGLAYVFGKGSALPYRMVFLALAFVGAIQNLETVIHFSDIMVGLLVIPNMLALIFLSGKVAAWTRTYFDDLKSGKIKPTHK